MDAHLAEFLFAQLVLLLATALCGLVAYLLKRHISTTDAMGAKLDSLNTSVARLIERDRNRRLGDYTNSHTEEEKA